VVPARKISATGGIATAVLVAAPMAGRQAARVVVEFLYRTRSKAPSVCVARVLLAVLLALRAVRRIVLQRLSVTRNLRADRYTPQRNGQGMFQLQQGTGIRQQPKPLDGCYSPSF
jgi:hypothetical protein